MRTTIDLDEDLLKELRAEARRQKSSVKELLNRALRHGLQGLRRPNRRTRTFRCPTFSLGVPKGAINLDQALRLADAMEDLEVARKLEMRK